MKSSTYYFHLKTKILTDFQICISVPLKPLNNFMRVEWFSHVKCFYIFYSLNVFHVLMFSYRLNIFKCSIFFAGWVLSAFHVLNSFLGWILFAGWISKHLNNHKQRQNSDWIFSYTNAIWLLWYHVQKYSTDILWTVKSR